MSDSIETDLSKRLNEVLNVTRPWGAYAWVKVIVAYWLEPDGESSGFREEAQEVTDLFRSLFKYDVEEFIIPLTYSARRARQCILNALNEAEELQATGQGPCLLIVHYGGHGDRDDAHHQGQERRSVWAASPASDSPTVEWHVIQKEFEDVSTDILLLLDCCFAAQAAREREKVPGRIEMLAAAAMGVKTRLPGPRSFTHALLRTIRKHVDERGYVSTSAIATDLSKKSLNLETPIHLTLRHGTTDVPIRLVPYSDNPGVNAMDDLSGSSLRLLVKASADLRLNDVVHWLRSNLPAGVSSIQAEEVVRTTVTIRDAIQHAPEEQQTPLKSLRSVDVNEIVAIWSKAATIIDQCFRSRDSVVLSQAITKPTDQAAILLTNLKAINDGFTDALEQRLLLESPSHGGKSLAHLVEDEQLQALGVTDQLRMKKIILDNSTEADIEVEEPMSEILHTVLTKQRVEFKDYGQYLNPTDFPIVETRVRLLAELLNAPKSSEFRAMKCVRWYHQPQEHRFALEFEIPVEYQSASGTCSSISLSEVILRIRDRRRPSLGQRFNIAYILSKAVKKWHTLNWVHQSISSSNVIFFHRENGECDFESPFLQGFDFARPSLAPSIGTYVDDVDFNVYRHPDRQGPARQGHNKIHDLYSLGVVLLEIGLWEIAPRTAGIGRGTELTVGRVQTGLREAAARRLAHYAGQDYQEAVLTCLQADFAVDMDDSSATRLAQSFQIRTIDKLRKCSALR